MQDLGAGPLLAVVLWRHRVQSTVVRSWESADIKALALLLTFDNRGNSLVLTRAFFVNNEIYMEFLLNSQAQGLSGKNEQSTQTPLCWAPEARGQRKLHWLHRLKAGPDAVAQTCGFSFLSHFGRRSCFSNLMLLLACRAASFTHVLTPSERGKGLNTNAVLTYKRTATIMWKLRNCTHLASKTEKHTMENTEYQWSRVFHQ